MVGKFTILEPGKEPYTVSLSEGKVLVVGRGHTADVVVLDRLASRVHCELWHSGRECMAADLESLNGTYLNGKRFKQSVLHPGDRIAIGSTQIEFAVEETAPTEQTVPETPGRVLRCARCEVIVAQQGKYVRNSVELGSDVYCAECATHVQLQRETEGRPALRSTVYPEGSTSFVAKASPPEPRTSLFQELRRHRPAQVVPGTLHPDATVDRYLKKHLGEAACTVATRLQKAWYVLVLLAFILLFGHYIYFFHVTHILCSFYLVVIAYKLTCVCLSVVRRLDIQVTQAEIQSLRIEDLPTYTILVPLYKETEVAEKIVKNIKALDYPQEKLDVKLLLEEDDVATVEACQQADLPPNFETIKIPDSKPKTKPKACNHGLERAKGEYLVIYDAEDRPEPDQLKKAVFAFRHRVSPKTVCLQAKLNYFNPRQNLLTRWFTIEYTTWFDLYLPGLHALGGPIPLGGTSNHFKTDVLREVGGWDPFNVTEDCDLGVRLYRMGCHTEILDSTTWEEANSKVYNWIRQRSRWVKGYIQTHLVHMRRPFRTLRELGPWGFFSFIVSVGGLAITLLLNPIFWAVVLAYFVLWAIHLTEPNLVILGMPVRPWQMVYPLTEEYNYFSSMVSIVFFVLTATMFVANFFFIFTHIFACFRRGLKDLIPHAILMPLYWVLISVAAWKGFLQLFFKPFYWEKTLHGLDVASLAGSPPPPGGPMPR